MAGSETALEANAFTSLEIPDRKAARVFFLLTTALAAFSLPQLFETGKFSGQFAGSYSLQWVMLLAIHGLLALVNLFFLVVTYTYAAEQFGRLANRLIARLARFGLWNYLGFGLGWAAFVLAVLWRYEKHYAAFLPRVWIFWLAVGVGAVFLMAWRRRLSFFWAVIITALLYGAGVKALGYLPDISAFPFSLSWSEASRYYYASLPVSRWLYGFDIPLSPMHPSRYLLQSMAFWIPGATILVHRLWQVILWLLLPLITGWVLARRFQFSRLTALLVAVWCALFLLQGPVYYHLLVCVILVLIGFERHRFWKSMIFIVLGSAWAGISRINWLPVPAFLGALLYFLERPVCELDGKIQQPFSRWIAYLLPPAAWGLAGGVAGLAAQAAYVLVSRQPDTSAFGSSFTSALLWYRLLPSPTYPMGVLPAILLVSAPLLILIIVSVSHQKQDWHFIRLAGIAVMALILFAGGLVVSTKIGGGSNIHNLDAFLVLLLVAGVYFWQGRVASERGRPVKVFRPWWLVLALVVAPVVWNLNVGDPFVRRDFQQASYDLQKMTQVVQTYAAQGEVLFITQRQLVMFDLIPGVRMVPDYELMTLTEMSISNNRGYLERFYQDLSRHRFALIVADRQSQYVKNPEVDAFAEENNAWAENIAPYLTKYYQSELFFDTQGIDTLVPR